MEDEKRNEKETPHFSGVPLPGPREVLGSGSLPLGDFKTISKEFEEALRKASAELEKDLLGEAEKVIDNVLQRMKGFMQGVLVGVLAGFVASISVALMEYYAVPIYVYWALFIGAATFIPISILILSSKWYRNYLVRSMEKDQLFRPVIGKSVMSLEHALEEFLKELDPEKAEQMREAAKKIAKEMGMKSGKVSMPPQSE